MKHITDIIVYKNRCEVIQSHSYTEGDIGAPHLRMIFDYMFERDSLKGLTLECKYILPSGEYSIKNVEITEDKEVLFPIYYSVFEHSGWTTLKATLVDENDRITLDDIVLRVKKLNTDNVHENKQFDNMLESEVKIEVQTITDAIKKEIDDYVKINKETLKGDPGVVDYSRVDGVVGECNGMFPLTSAKKGEVYYSDINKKYYICIESFINKNLNVPNIQNFEELSINKINNNINLYKRKSISNEVLKFCDIDFFKLGNLKCMKIAISQWRLKEDIGEKTINIKDAIKDFLPTIYFSNVINLQNSKILEIGLHLNGDLYFRGLTGIIRKEDVTENTIMVTFSYF